MNNKNGYAAHTLFRYLSVIPEQHEENIESFEEELCEFKASGYSVEGIAFNGGYLFAVLTKKLTDVPDLTAKKENP